jgi:hypothetical protein
MTNNNDALINHLPSQKNMFFQVLKAHRSNQIVHGIHSPPSFYLIYTWTLSTIQMIALFTTIVLHVPNRINSIVEKHFFPIYHVLSNSNVIYYTSIKTIVNESLHLQSILVIMKNFIGKNKKSSIIMWKHIMYGWAIFQQKNRCIKI